MHLGASELRWLRQAEEKTSRLKQLDAPALRRRASESETGLKALSTGELAVAYVSPASKAYRVASWLGPDSDQPY